MTAMKTRGNITIALLFVLLISIAGMGLLTHSIIHGKIGGARQKNWTHREKLFGPLFLHLHRYLERLAITDISRYPAPENDFFNRLNFPDNENGGILIRGRFRTDPLEIGEFFQRLRITYDVQALLRKPPYVYAAQISADLLKGRIPLNEIPLMINGPDPENVEQFLEKTGIRTRHREKPIVAKTEVTFNLKAYLLDSLKIKGTTLGWPEIRKKLKMDVSGEPIAEGLYLVGEGDMVEAVFIQGDVDSLRFSIVGDRQMISIRFRNTLYALSYIPGQCSLDSWEGRGADGRCFQEKIMVNGNIWNLEQEGTSAFVDGSRIQILTAGKIIVQSSLKSEPLELKDISFSHIALISTDKNLVSQSDVEAGIVLSAREDIQIQGNLISAGKVINSGKTVRIDGSLYGEAVENSGIIETHSRPGRFDSSRYLTTGDFRYLKNIIVRSFMEEENE